MCLLMLTKVLMLLITVCTFFSLLDQYVSHGFDVYLSSINSTRVVVITRPSCSEIWHSGHNRHIASPKRTQKQAKIGYSVFIYKTIRIHSKIILAVSPEI